VEADTYYGAIYGLGFVHAKDRLWQLNFYRYLTSGRLAELVGSTGVPIDKFVRTIGMPRAAKAMIASLNDEDRNFLQNYVNGINKVAENVALYPAEFYILMTGFDKFTIDDVAGMIMFFRVFLTRDWDVEYLRGRLTEIYDREFVDRLLPFQKKHYFDTGNMETILDHELEQFGFYVPENAENLFRVDEELYHLRAKSKDKFDFQANFKESKWGFQELVSGWNNVGSNCWAIHGNFTHTGKPILSCDPHLGKFASPTWYPVRISWNETITEQTDSGPVRSSYRTYIAGHGAVGVPLFGYIKTPFLAGGATALNPDAKDLFLEEVEDGKYLSSDGTWQDVEKIHEVIKVRLGSDVHFDIQYTDNGVLLPKDIMTKDTRPFHDAVVQEMWESDDIWNQGKMYALAQYFDPLVFKNLHGADEQFWPLLS